AQRTLQRVAPENPPRFLRHGVQGKLRRQPCAGEEVRCVFLRRHALFAGAAGWRAHSPANGGGGTARLPAEESAARGIPAALLGVVAGALARGRGMAERAPLRVAADEIG